ncbi:hypothetical protein [Streptomyces sp. NPDC127114]|uniref:hypothetical protein n=1 Tax=Streptomyces sp. NPDC127114 TaxID=3345366 RepID=UPI00363A0F0B
MSSLRTSFRRLLGLLRSAQTADVRFCDGCAEVTDRVDRATAGRRSRELALTFYAPHI